MDRITEFFVEAFVADSGLSLLSPDKQFERFSSFVTVRRYYAGETFDTTDISTGDGGDTGIDAIAIIVNGSIVSDIEDLQTHIGISGSFDVQFIS